MRWGDLSFRWKLLLSLSGLAAVITAAILYFTSRQIERSHETLFADAFRREVARFERERLERLSQAQAACAALTRQVRFIATLREANEDAGSADAAAVLYNVVRNELESPAAKALIISKAVFFRVISAEGRIIPPLDERAGLPTLQLSSSGITNAVTGYLTHTNGRAVELIEVIHLPVIDVSEDALIGGIALGFKAELPERDGDGDAALSGIWRDGRLFSANIPPGLGGKLAQQLSQTGGRSALVADEGEEYRLFASRIGQSDANSARQVVLFSTRAEREAEAQLKATVVALGAAALIASIVIGLMLAKTLSEPITELSSATEKIAKGEYEVRVTERGRDEVGQLSASFNAMAAGLEMKEKYRSVLDLVADKSVAEELIAGKISLGGELREVSVLFCDIRGFTALTERMQPEEVIQMLNNHFAPLTQVVYAHNGIVDKFVGDLIMAVFGAPRPGDGYRHCLGAGRCWANGLLGSDELYGAG